MSGETEFRVRYWGVRGTFARCLRPDEVTDKLVAALLRLREDKRWQAQLEAATDEESLRAGLAQWLPYHLRSTYGGNTSCVEIRTRQALLIVDAGSGLRELGVDLNRRWNTAAETAPRRAHILITHAHLDHTVATPFNDAFYDPRNHFSIWAPQPVLDSLTALLGPNSRLRSVYFPLHFDLLRGIRELRPIQVGDEFEIEGTCISTHELNHPSGCVAYRFEQGGRRIVFASDHEHLEAPDRGLAEFSCGADLLYLDAQYLQAEYEGRQGLPGEPPIARRGWGHSTVEATIATALAANVRLLHLGHHDPKRSDEDLAKLELDAQAELQRQLSRCGRAAEDCRLQLASEGLTLEI